MRFLAVLIFGLACVASSVVRAAEVDFGRYHALVIGNNKYEHLTPLETAVSDAAAVAEILRLKYGFEVELLINASRDQILSAVNKLRSSLTDRDRLLIYYAGHGELDRATGTGYWLPVDAEPEDDTRWVANETLTRHFRGMTAHHVMVVADSCYSGALVRSANAAPKAGSEQDAWLRRVAEKRARTALVSGGLEPVVDEGTGGHSVFANAFLGVLRENSDILDGQTLAKSVTQKVVLNADQTPQYSDIRKAGHEGGDFLFVPKGLVVAAPPSGAGTGGAEGGRRGMELEFWAAIKDDTDPAVFEAYLEQFPKGTFAALARIKIRKLKAGGVPAPAKAATAMVAPPSPAIAVEEVVGTFVALRNVNLRSRPTTTSEKVATLRQGAEVWVTGKVARAEWYRVDHAGREAYVYAPLLQGKTAWEAAEEETRRVAEAKRKRLAATTPPKPVARALPRSSSPLHDCDRYAASPYDEQRSAPSVSAKKMDVERALRACKRAVAAFPDAPRFAAQYGRALAIAKQYADAVRWYRKAAERGVATAQQSLGWMYRKGRGVEKNYEAAVSWYRKAAAQGHPVARNNLGFMYEKGWGVPKDHGQAVNWYRRAAAQGYALAQFNMGQSYRVGRGVEKDLEQAARWYRKAAEQSNIKSQYFLGRLYDEGRGVARDRREAIRWWRKAAAGGHEKAKEKLRKHDK
ncbi:MAG: caspase family protein [Alphaproteobacteria bacterium]|jgi:TPR repeat protein/uncharacterized caspase-like protein|nr:caspase family protein [Alphaproteobacteria bacterium]